MHTHCAASGVPSRTSVLTIWGHTTRTRNTPIQIKGGKSPSPKEPSSSNFQVSSKVTRTQQPPEPWGFRLHARGILQGLNFSTKEMEPRTAAACPLRGDMDQVPKTVKRSPSTLLLTGPNAHPVRPCWWATAATSPLHSGDGSCFEMQPLN